jgi:plastocyanin
MKRTIPFLFLGLSVLSCSDDDEPAVDESEAVRVRLSPDRFDPPTLTIKTGQTVRWIWGGGDHNVVSGEDCTENGIFKSGEPQAGGTFERKFETAGTFPYYCRNHCRSGMTGTIIVQ